MRDTTRMTSNNTNTTTTTTDPDFTEFITNGIPDDNSLEKPSNNPIDVSNNDTSASLQEYSNAPMNASSSFTNVNEISSVTRTTNNVMCPTCTGVDNNLISSNASNGNHEYDAPSHDNANGRNAYVTAKDFKLLSVIGLGSFGKVLLVQNKRNHNTYAMKCMSKRLLIRKDNVKSSSNYVENILVEKRVMEKIRSHPFIVTMHCSFQSKTKLFIVMDFLSGGELFLRLGREGIFREKEAAFYLGEIVLALEHLHTHGVLHRDLKPENILLCADGHVCITDFGLAKDFSSNLDLLDSVGDFAKTVCGTCEYMAPEMVARKGYGKGADYWSLGCIAYEMLSGDPPFRPAPGKGTKDLISKIMNSRIKMPDGASAFACKLIKGLLNRNPNARLGVAKGTMFEVGGVSGLKRSQFFDTIDWQKLELKEVTPPYCPSASDSADNELSNFHEEFTKMSLPRSVTEMACDSYRPRRVESDLFRGFSFTQPDFELPERDIEDSDHYWNNPEADGESEGSSIAMLESGTTIGDQNTTSDLPMEPIAEKKKRPPRNKKKKKAVVLDTPEEVPLPPQSKEPGNSIDNKDDDISSTVETRSQSDAKDINDTPLARMLKKQIEGGEQKKPKENQETLSQPVPAWTVVASGSIPPRRLVPEKDDSLPPTKANTIERPPPPKEEEWIETSSKKKTLSQIKSTQKKSSSTTIGSSAWAQVQSKNKQSVASTRSFYNNSKHVPGWSGKSNDKVENKSSLSSSAKAFDPLSFPSLSHSKDNTEANSAAWPSLGGTEASRKQSITKKPAGVWGVK